MKLSPINIYSYNVSIKSNFLKITILQNNFTLIFHLDPELILFHFFVFHKLNMKIYTNKLNYNLIHLERKTSSSWTSKMNAFWYILYVNHLTKVDKEEEIVFIFQINNCSTSEVIRLPQDTIWKPWNSS